MERILLIGSDDVVTGGRMMQSAAEDMRRAASTIESSLYSHEMFLREWLVDFSNLLTQSIGGGQ